MDLKAHSTRMMVRGSIENFFRASKNSIFVVIMLVMSLSPLANDFEIFIDDAQKLIILIQKITYG